MKTAIASLARCHGQWQPFVRSPCTPSVKASVAWCPASQGRPTVARRLVGDRFFSSSRSACSTEEKYASHSAQKSTEKSSDHTTTSASSPFDEQRGKYGTEGVTARQYSERQLRDLRPNMLNAKKRGSSARLETSEYSAEELGYTPRPLTVARGEGYTAPESANEEQEPVKPLTDRPMGSGADSKKWEAVDEESEKAARKANEPTYQLTFTCAKCLCCSSHRITKQAYHYGTVLVNCPDCKNKHLISDHLGVFSDRKVTLEDIMREKGEKLKKGVLGADGNVEFY